MLQYFKVLFVLLAGISCNVNDDCRKCPVNEFDIIDSVRIPLEGLPYTYWLTDIYQSEEITELWTYHEFSGNIYVFDIKKNQLTKTIHIPYQGPEQFPKIWDWYIVNGDSIFLFTNQRKKLFLINDQAEILRTWSLDLPLQLPLGSVNPDGYYYASFPQTGNPGIHITKDLSHLYMYVHKWMNRPGEAYVKEVYEIPYIARFDMETGEIDELFGQYPETYISDVYSSYELISPFTVLENDKVLAFFERSHEIQFYEKNRKRRIRCVQSQYLDSHFDLLNHGYDQDKMIDHYNMKGSYVNLIHDPFRKRIIRIAAHDQPDKDQNNVSLDKRRAKWSLLILDYEGNCLGEYLFPKETYDFMSIFAIPKGIMVSRENPYNFSDPEEILSFDILAL